MRKSTRNKTTYSRAERALEICHEYRKRIPKLEKLIASEEGTAYIYAMDIVEGSFPEGEPIILENPRLAIEYAIFVLDAPFERGHSVIFDSKNDQSLIDEYVEFLTDKGYDKEKIDSLLIQYSHQLI